jgi:hypothetical protein
VAALAVAAVAATGCELRTASRFEKPFEHGRIRLSATRPLLPKKIHIDNGAVARRMRQTLDWYTQALVGAYEQHGVRNVSWDAEVQTGLTFVARAWANDPARPGDAEDQAWFHLRRAVSLGAGDPLVRFALETLSTADFNAKDSARHIASAATRLDATTTYAPYVRGSALLTAAVALHETYPSDPSIAALVDRANDYIPALVSDAALPAHLLTAYVDRLSEVDATATGRDRQQALGERLATIRTGGATSEQTVAVVNAVFYAAYASDARGAGAAGDVTAEAWPKFFARLERAEAEAARAVSLGSTDPLIARVMTTVGMGLHHDRAELDEWFRIGTRLDPGNLAWYSAKLEWLGPEWFGSHNAALEYGRSLRQTAPWGIRAPMIFLDALTRAAGPQPEAARFWRQGSVCDDVQSLYEAFLAKYPDASADRSRYAMRLADCGRWKDADRQFKLLGPDRARVGVFGGQAKYDAQRRMAAERASNQF